MKVLLVGNYGWDNQRSMARYAELLHSELLKRGHEAEVIRPSAIAARLVSRGSRLSRWLGYVDKFVLFPPLLWLRARRAEIVHVCDHSNSFYLRWSGKAARVITAHDALAIRSALGDFPQNPTRWSGVRLQRWILSGLKHAGRIICVSEKTREDFAALLPGGPPMTVISNPLAANFRRGRADDVKAARLACGLGPQDEYLLHVGKDNWYKNRQGVLRIMALLRSFPRFREVKLVMAGAALSAKLREKARTTGGVVEYAGPSDEQLRALYSGALALLFPSLEEGFGWPVLEAQACGCPVITSARSPMKEVAGGAAILIDPTDERGAAEVIAERIAEAEALRGAGLENARGYSLEATMDKYCAVYREMAGETIRR